MKMIIAIMQGDSEKIVTEELNNAERLLAKRFHGTEERGLLVESLAAVGAERCGDAESFSFDKCI